MNRPSVGSRLSSGGPLRVRNTGNDVGKPGTSRGQMSGIRRSSFGFGGTKRTSYGAPATKAGTQGRSSLTSKKRRSSSYGRNYGDYQIVKDPRPTGDKGFKQKSIRELIEFLVGNSYPHPIAPKILHSPTSKDFIKIYEFLIRFVSPDYKIGTRYEEEVPKMFKAISYPFTITKSAMISVGSPHTWPTILAALTWLRELVQYIVGLDIELVMFPVQENDFDSISEEKLLWDFVETSYDDYMHGSDTYDEYEAELAKAIRNNGAAGDIEKISGEKRRLQETYQALQEAPDRLSNLKDKVTHLTTDIEKYEIYLDGLDNHTKMQEQSLSAQTDKETAIDAELKAIQENIAKKQHIYNTQEFSKSDVDRFHLSRMELQRQIEAAEKESEAVDKDFWDGEIASSKIQQKVEGKCEEFNKIARNLKLIPKTAENANGLDLEMKANFTFLDSVDFDTTIKPALNEMKKKFKEHVNELEEKKFTKQEQLDEICDIIQEKKESLRSLEVKQKRSEEAIESKKELMQNDCKKLEAEAEKLHQELDHLRRRPAVSVFDVKKKLQEVTIECEQRNQKRKADTDKLKAFCLEACSVIIDHKFAIESISEKFHNDVKATYERELNGEFSVFD